MVYFKKNDVGWLYTLVRAGNKFPHCISDVTVYIRIEMQVVAKEEISVHFVNADAAENITTMFTNLCFCL